MPRKITPVPPLPIEVEEENIGLHSLNAGRPRVIPLRSVLRRLPSTSLRANDGGIEAVDLSVTAEVIAVLEAIILEAALADEKIPAEKKVEWVLRSAPFLSRLTEGFARKKGTNMPKTVDALKEEFAARSESIRKLQEQLGTPEGEAAATEAVNEVLPDEGENVQ